MKRFVLLICLLFFNYSFSQCPIEIKDLMNSQNYSLSEFDSFALNRGYSYNSNTNMYNCDDKINNKPNDSYNSVFRGLKDGFTTIGYTFMDKQEYLSKKIFLEENFELISNKTIDNSLEYIFKIKNKQFIMLKINTVFYKNENINIYVLVIL